MTAQPTSPATPGLSARLSRWLAWQTLLGLGLVCLSVYVVIAMTLAQRQETTLAEKRQTLAELLQEPRIAQNSAAREQTLNDFLAGHGELSLHIVDAEGGTLYLRQGTGGTATAAAAKPTRVTGAQRSLSFELPGLPLGARTTLSLDPRPDTALLRRLAWTLALAALAGAGVVSACSVWLVRRGLAPLRVLVAQTGALSAQDRNRRLDATALPQELQPLVEQFNALLDRLTAASAQMEAFNADVAHELKTPLATLISGCELALRKPRTAAELHGVLASSLEDLHRLSGIVSDMLFLSRADQGADARVTQVDSLAGLALQVLEFHEAALQDAGLHARVEGDASAEVDARLVCRALSNLLGNATRHATPGSTLVVRIAPPLQGETSVSVCNDGPPIAAVHLPRIFDRFYRGNAARSDADRNHGLGLAIVAGIARMHGGRVLAESDGGSTRIGFTLPIRHQRSAGHPSV